MVPQKWPSTIPISGSEISPNGTISRAASRAARHASAHPDLRLNGHIPPATRSYGLASRGRPGAERPNHPPASAPRHVIGEGAPDRVRAINHRDRIDLSPEMGLDDPHFSLANRAAWERFTCNRAPGPESQSSLRPLPPGRDPTERADEPGRLAGVYDPEPYERPSAKRGGLRRRGSLPSHTHPTSARHRRRRGNGPRRSPFPVGNGKPAAAEMGLAALHFQVAIPSPPPRK